MAAARNRTVALALGGVVLGMAGLAYASVPLYRLFCQVTGYGGTTQVAAAAPGADRPVSDRVITVRFNADTAKDLPWRFAPAQTAIEVRVGETALAHFRAANRGAEPVTGTAAFNVTPQKAGLYFSKIDCFCFTEQRLAPGQEADMPVSFFIDPDIQGDPNLDEVTTITLSYTFFRLADEPADHGAEPAAHLSASTKPRSATDPPGDATDG